MSPVAIGGAPACAAVPLVSSWRGERGEIAYGAVGRMKGGAMKRIVVGIDGSQGSRNALTWAVDEARAHGGSSDP